MARTYLFFGRNGSGKTSAAIADATPEQPVSYHELEHGGYRRAAGRLRLADGAVLVHHYRVPAPEMEDGLGEIQVTSKGGVMPQVNYRLSGWTELIAEFNKNYREDVAKGYRVVIDTSTRLWLAQRNAFEQQVQDAASKQAADQLGQLRFTAPNARMIASAIYGLEHYDVDVVSIAHEDRAFGTNDIKIDTQKEIENLVDVVLRFEWEDRPVATIYKGGEVGILRGLKIPEPTLALVSKVLDCGAVIDAAGLPMPSEVSAIIEQGQALGAR